MRQVFVLAAVLCMALASTGCTVQDKKSGNEENVRIHTPVGGLDVRTNSAHPVDVGLPVYPGAVPAPANGDDKNKSADVSMGFADWRLHVRVSEYQSSDAQDKVVDYYRKALGRYGDVLTCQDKKAIGTPAKTQDGLTCSNDHRYDVHISVDSNNNHTTVTAQSRSGDLELRAGSPDHQRIVAFAPPAGVGTRFTLINLELPHGHGTD